MARVTKRMQLKGVRASYVKIAEPGLKFNGDGYEYSVQLIIPKDHPQLDDLKKMIVDTLKEAFPKLSASQKASLKKGLRDNDEEGRSEEFPYLANTMFINAKRPESFGPVPCFDRGARPMTPTNDTLFSGCLINAGITIFSFDSSASKGVSCGIDALQVVDNNCERWDGTPDVSNMFSALEGAEEDPVKTGKASAEASAEASGDEVTEDDIPW